MGSPAGPRGDFCSAHGTSFLPVLLTVLEIAAFGGPGHYNNCSAAFMDKAGSSKELRQGAKRKSWQV